MHECAAAAFLARGAMADVAGAWIAGKCELDCVAETGAGSGSGGRN